MSDIMICCLTGESAVLGKGGGVMKAKGRLFQARGFYATLALQAQDSAPVTVSQVPIAV